MFTIQKEPTKFFRMAEDFMTTERFTAVALDNVMADFESGVMAPFLNLDVADEPEHP